MVIHYSRILYNAGRIEEINGVNTYIALPDREFPKEKAILFLTGKADSQWRSEATTQPEIQTFSAFN